MKNDKQLIKQLNYAIENNDEELINQVFEDIYHKYNKLVKYISYKIVKRIDIADDITQDTFINFYNRINKIDLTNIKYYLTTTARNLSINFIKSFHERNIFNDDLFFEFLNDDGSEEIKEMIEELKIILSPEEVEIIVLHLVFNYTFREIGIEKNKTVSSISGRYRRAIKKFKKHYKK